MEIAIIVVFAIGYIIIALEHPLKINKTATALITGVVCWMLFTLSSPSASLLSSENFQTFTETLKLDIGEKGINELTSSELYSHFVTHELGHHIITISGILFFLLGAMTIVELIDAHHGFRFITDKIKT